MSRKQSPPFNWLQSTLVRITRFHFLFIGAYLISIVIFDSWNLITYGAVINFWTAGGIMLVLNTLLWYIGRIYFSSEKVYLILIYLLIFADIVLIAVTVYWQRGLSSNAVALFAVPLCTAAALRSRTTLLATASLCTAAYSLAAVRYFYEHYGEAYRVELYGEIAFYSAMFFIITGLLWVIIHPEQKH